MAAAQEMLVQLDLGLEYVDAGCRVWPRLPEVFLAVVVE